MNIARLRRFVADMTSLVGGAWQDHDEAAIVEVGRTLLADLVKHDDWLPDAMARCPPHGYAANLLWCDPFERFSIVSLVRAPGAETPVHDHQVWGLVGILRGSETSQRFVLDAASGALARGS
ncbi:MAG TPA: cysteine dioxygenase, partial [Reyranella sp.]|nr:cysteine dioxygenase [Reyranella sp.]